MIKKLKGKSVLLTFPPRESSKYPSHGVRYVCGDVVPEEHWHYIEKSGGELVEVEEVKKVEKKSVKKKVSSLVKKAVRKKSAKKK